MPARKVIGYTRVSTAEQVEGFGLTVQRRAITDYCKENGLRLVEVLTDEGVSGSNGLEARKGLSEVLAVIDVHSGDCGRLFRFKADTVPVESGQVQGQAVPVVAVGLSSGPATSPGHLTGYTGSSSGRWAAALGQPT
jgi:hypothetical protein